MRKAIQKVIHYHINSADNSSFQLKLLAFVTFCDQIISYYMSNR